MALNEISPQDNEIVAALTFGLKATYQLHETLGDAGRSNLQPNQFGEMALVMDVQSEEAILNALRRTTSSFEVFSEEHGKFTHGDNPLYTVVADGLDGSDEYKKGRGARMYGSMASVLRSLNPTYDDYLASGIMIHSPQPRLYLAVKNRGCFVEDVQTGIRNSIEKPQWADLNSQSRIDLDTNWPPYKDLLQQYGSSFPNMDCRYFSAAAQCALFLEGSIDIAPQYTRKGNLEHPTMYGLIKETGGEIATIEGLSIGPNKFREFGQDRRIPLVIARSGDVAKRTSVAFNLSGL